MAEINEHGVAVNAELHWAVKTKNAELEIRLAEHEGKWAYGYRAEVNKGNEGVGIPVTNFGFDTKDQAFDAAHDEAVEWIKERCSDKFWHDKEESKQLSLF